MQSDIGKAITIFRDMPEIPDHEAFHALVDSGVDRVRASRLVEFVPMAYCRAVLGTSGAKFPDVYHRMQSNGEKSPARALSSEPVWVAAIAYAREEIKAGVSLTQLVTIARRSAEYAVANDLLHDKTAKLKDLVFTAPILMWPEDGPGDN